MDDLDAQLARLAAAMPALPAVPEVSVGYDMMSDALLWPDELPKPELFSCRHLWCLRPLLRYRTSLILGRPDERCRPAWECARRLFPRWVGFRPERRSPELATTYSDFEQRARMSFENVL